MLCIVHRFMKTLISWSHTARVYKRERYGAEVIRTVKWRRLVTQSVIKNNIKVAKRKLLIFPSNWHGTPMYTSSFFFFAIILIYKFELNSFQIIIFFFKKKRKLLNTIKAILAKVQSCSNFCHKSLAPGQQSQPNLTSSTKFTLFKRL